MFICEKDMSYVLDILGCGCTEGRLNESLTLSIPKIRILFELEEPNGRSPLVLLKAATESTVYNWSTSMQIKGILSILDNYFFSY
jgi:hypothetical protein